MSLLWQVREWPVARRIAPGIYVRVLTGVRVEWETPPPCARPFDAKVELWLLRGANFCIIDAHFYVVARVCLRTAAGQKPVRRHASARPPKMARVRVSARVPLHQSCALAAARCHFYALHARAFACIMRLWRRFNRQILVRVAEPHALRAYARVSARSGRSGGQNGWFLINFLLNGATGAAPVGPGRSGDQIGWFLIRFLLTGAPGAALAGLWPVWRPEWSHIVQKNNSLCKIFSLFYRILHYAKYSIKAYFTMRSIL